jgi:DNA invertase Pin-like site-specific DNA recombinase
MSKRAVIFVRVSTRDKQDVERQIRELSEYAQSKKYEIVEVVEEKISGTKKNIEREGIQKLFKLSEPKKFDVLLISEISRLGRNTSETLQVLEHFNNQKISIFSLNFGLETLNDNGTPNHLSIFLFTILSEISRMEREQIVERIKSGLDNCRKKGIVLGRKKGTTESREDILKKYGNVRKRLSEGYSLRDITKICGVSINTIRKVKKCMNGLL